ncbi:hypothetical protein Xoosp13_175 [Xanthomonas phage Xoo-sp13]|nr:hypothetical protein Xoosp13_175 [Xanthomonas phage Xoo-sp13]
MHKSFIKINASDVTSADVKAMLQSQRQFAALTDMVDAARRNKMELEGSSSLTEKFFSEVKKIIS